MEGREPQLDRRHHEVVVESEEDRAIRREHILTQYRKDHPVFDQYMREHDVADEQGYALLADVSRDPKTGVQRSDLLEATLLYEIHEARNDEAKKFSVAVFDIDNFHDINTELTHIGGDDVLHKVAKLIRGQEEFLLGDNKSVVRWGGEEFVVLFRGTTQEQAHQAAEHIRQRIAESLTTLRPSGKPVTVSGGVVEYQADQHKDWQGILQAADEQMLLAKSAGKNVIFPKAEGEAAA